MWKHGYEYSFVRFIFQTWVNGADDHVKKLLCKFIYTLMDRVTFCMISYIYMYVDDSRIVTTHGYACHNTLRKIQWNEQLT